MNSPLARTGYFIRNAWFYPRYSLIAWIEAPGHVIWYPILAAILALLTYIPSLSVTFYADDVLNIAFSRIDHVSDIWLPFQVGLGGSGFYRPLINVLYGVEYAIWGGWAPGYHLTNLLFHASSAFLVTRLALQIWPSRPLVGAIAGVIFAIHPIHVVPVVWISGRTDLVATFLSLLGFTLLLAAVERQSLLRLSLATFAFSGAFFAKEVALINPLVVAGLLWWWISRPQVSPSIRKWAILAWFPLGGVFLLYLLIRVLLIRELAGVQPGYNPLRLAEGPGWETLIATSLFHVGRLNFAFFFPGDFSYPDTVGTLARLTGLALPGFFWITAGWWRSKKLTWVVGWAMLSIVPAGHVLHQAMGQPAGAWYFYLPSVGWSLAIGRVLDVGRSLTWSGRRILNLLSVFFLLVIVFWHSLWTQLQIRYWIDGSPIIEHIINRVSGTVSQNPGVRAVSIDGLPTLLPGRLTPFWNAGTLANAVIVRLRPQSDGLGGDDVRFDSEPRIEIPSTDLAFIYRDGILRDLQQDISASIDYGSRQEHRNWSYLAGPDSQRAWQMAWNPHQQRWVSLDPHLFIEPARVHPGTLTTEVIRRWTSPITGTVIVAVTAEDSDPRCGDGVGVAIRRDGETLLERIIPNGSSEVARLELSFPVRLGSWVDTVIHPRQDSGCDSTRVDTRIRLPEAEVFTQP